MPYVRLPWGLLLIGVGIVLSKENSDAPYFMGWGGGLIALCSINICIDICQYLTALHAIAFFYVKYDYFTRNIGAYFHLNLGIIFTTGIDSFDNRPAGGFVYRHC